jgi:hypothetical protein
MSKGALLKGGASFYLLHIKNKILKNAQKFKKNLVLFVKVHYNGKK